MLDIVVRDKRGNRVTDLKPGDLEIFDNAVRRKVLSFKQVEGHRALPGEKTADGKPTPLNPLQQIRLVTLIFNRLDLDSRRLAHTAATDLLKSEFPGNVYMSVSLLDDSLHALQPFTNDRTLLRAAVDHATSGAYKEFTSDSRRIEDQMRQILGPSTAGESIGEKVQESDDATGQMARMMLNMLQPVQRSEFSQPGRSAICFNVSFYSIDARGLTASSANEGAVDGLKDASSAHRASAMTSAGAVTPAMANGIDTAINAGKNGGQDTLADLAQSTGGFLIANSNDFREGLRKVSEDIESYYEITYNPQIASYDGSYRKIEVRPLRSGLRIQSRAGYFALPVSAGNGEILSPYEVPLLQALNTNPLPNAFDFESPGLHFRGPHNEPGGSVVLDIPLASATLRQKNAKSPYQGDLAYVAIVKNASGEVLEKFRGDVSLAETAAQMPALQNSHFIFSRSVFLTPGRYTLEAAVIDRTDNHVSARKTTFLPASESRLAMSSVALVRSVRDQSDATRTDDPFQLGGKVITPSLGSVTRAEQRGPGFYMVIYPDRNNGRKPEIVVKFSRDAVPVGSGSLVLPDPDAAGRIQYVAATAPDKMEPGNYQAEFFVIQGAETARETATFTIN